MSYEGYLQCVCKKGHFFSCNDTFEYDPACHCGEQAAFQNSVDETNGECMGIIPQELFDKHFLITAEVRETCNLGHAHIISEAIYRIPTKEEGKKLEHYFDDTDMEYHLLSEYQDRRTYNKG